LFSYTRSSHRSAHLLSRDLTYIHLLCDIAHAHFSHSRLSFFATNPSVSLNSFSSISVWLLLSLCFFDPIQSLYARSRPHQRPAPFLRAHSFMMRGDKLDDSFEGEGLEDPVSLSLFASFFSSLPSFHLCLTVSWDAGPCCYPPYIHNIIAELF